MKNSRRKVIAINSSKRQKNTYGLLCELKKNLDIHEIDVDIINLFDYSIEHCLGCESCIRRDICPIDDDVNKLMKKLTDYDGIILSSPVYMSNISGKLKSFLDRTCKWFHRPELTGKPTLLVATTAGSDLKSTLKYLEKVSIHWGCFPTDKIGKNVRDLGNELEHKDYNSFINHLYKDMSKYKPSLNQIISFQVQKVLAMKILDIDSYYWKKHRWDNHVFYYDCSINFFKKFLSKSFYKMLYSKIEKVGD